MTRPNCRACAPRSSGRSPPSLPPRPRTASAASAPSSRARHSRSSGICGGARSMLQKRCFLRPHLIPDQVLTLLTPLRKGAPSGRHLTGADHPPSPQRRDRPQGLEGGDQLPPPLARRYGDGTPHDDHRAKPEGPHLRPPAGRGRPCHAMHQPLRLPRYARERQELLQPRRRGRPTSKPSMQQRREQHASIWYCD